MRAEERDEEETEDGFYREYEETWRLERERYRDGQTEDNDDDNR